MILKLLLIALLVYAGLVALLYFAQGKLLFQTARDLYRTPAINGWSYEDVWVDVPGGHRTHGWFIQAAPPARGTILFSHGNAGNIADRLESVAIFRDLRFDVLVYDYGGYGLSSGGPSERRCYEDIRAMWRHLTETRGLDPSKVVLFGRSLGAGPTAQLATEVEPAAVILESTFRSVTAMASELYPFVPARLFVRHRFDTETKVARLKSPVLFVHSRDDSVIPYAHGEALFQKASEPKQFLEITGDHNEGFWMSGNVYTDGLDAFLTPLLIGRAASAGEARRP